MNAYYVSDIDLEMLFLLYRLILLSFLNHTCHGSRSLVDEAHFAESIRKYFIHGGFNDEVIRMFYHFTFPTHREDSI